MALAYTEFEVDDVSFHIFTLPDRRPTAGSSQPVKWLYQMDVESFSTTTTMKQGVTVPSTGCSNARPVQRVARSAYAKIASAWG